MSPNVLPPERLDIRTRLAAMAECVRQKQMTLRRFIRQVWPHVQVDHHQVDIIRSMLAGIDTDLNELAIKGCTGSGKGTAVAMGICLWFELAPVCRIVLTSSKFEHVKNVLFAEVVKWRKLMQFPAQGQTLESEVKVSEQKRIVCLNPAVPESFSGFHGPTTLAVFDESTYVESSYVEMAATWAKLRVYIGNPRTLSGWFRELFDLAEDPDRTQTISLPEGGKRRLVTVSGSDCANVHRGKVVLEGQITKERLAAIMAHPNPDYGRVFGEGKFPREDVERQLVLPSWLPRHWAAWHKGIEVVAFSLDVADSETGDETILAAGGYDGIRRLHARRKAGTMKTIGWVLAVASKRYGIDLTQGDVPICVDADGIGRGVADRLEEQGVCVIRHIGAESAENKKAHANMRAQTWCMLGERLNPDGPWGHSPWALPKDAKLQADMVAQERVEHSDPFITKLLPKEAKSGEPCVRRKLHGRSPDRGDAAAYLWHAVRKLIEDETLSGSAGMFVGTPGEKSWTDAELKERRKKGDFDKSIEEALKYYDKPVRLRDDDF